MADQHPSRGQEAIAAAAGAVPGLLMRLFSNPQKNIPPELTQLLQNSVARTNYQNPLFQAVSNQAFQGLPAYAREGLSMPSQLTMPASQSQQGGGGMNPLLAGGIGAGLGALAGSPMGQSAFSNLLKGLKKLFGHHAGGGAIGGQNPLDQYGGGMVPEDFLSNYLNAQGVEQGGDQPLSPDMFGGFQSDPLGQTNTQEFFNWPETQSPFEAFDPSQLPSFGSGEGGGDAGYIDPWYGAQ